MTEISVIIPVYNVEQYIEKCIESVINQTFKEIQIILVDDGTKDRSGQICDEYASKDERILVIHKENGGLSDARNAGMKHAEGRYILFVDSDDYIKQDMLEYLYNNITEHQTDMSTCGVYEVYEDHIAEQDYVPGEVVSSEKAFSYILQGTNIKGAIWNKLMKRTIIQGMEFPVGKTYEDVFFTFELMRRVKTVYVGTESKYYYLHRENSISTKPYCSQDHDIIDGYAKTYQTVKRDFPGLKTEAQFRVIWSWFHVFDKIIMEPDYPRLLEYQELKKKICRNFIKIMQNPYFQRNRKLAAGILMFSTRLYRAIVLWNQEKNLKLKR